MLDRGWKPLPQRKRIISSEGKGSLSPLPSLRLRAVRFLPQLGGERRVFDGAEVDPHVQTAARAAMRAASTPAAPSEAALGLPFEMTARPRSMIATASRATPSGTRAACLKASCIARLRSAFSASVAFASEMLSVPGVRIGIAVDVLDEFMPQG